eukprot:EG_transcript_11168
MAPLPRSRRLPGPHVSCRLLAFLLQLLASLSCVAGQWVFQDPINGSYLEAWANSTFRSGAADLSFLRNASVVFVGDSVTRYQYLYLAQYLHWQQWDDVKGNKLGYEPHYETFTNMFKAYPGVFGCHHICDCVDHLLFLDTVTVNGTTETQLRRHSHARRFRTENQYFRHPPLNASVDFHMWTGAQIGMNFFPQTPSAADFDEYCRSFPANADMYLTGPLEANHSYPDLPTFIDAVLRPMRPRVLVLNYGLWRGLTESFHKAKASILAKHNLGRLIAAARAAAPVVVWKTTTASHSQAPDDPHLLETLRRNGVLLFDAHNLTRALLPLKTAAMWDASHFEPFVYRELNIALLEFLQDVLGSQR